MEITKIICGKNAQKAHLLFSQQIFACLELTIEMLEKGVKYIQS